MTAIFKCQKCGHITSQDVERYGLMIGACSKCRHIYLDCQNLEECVKWCEEEDALDNTALQKYLEGE